MKRFLASAILTSAALSLVWGQTLSARRSSNYDPNRRDGRFDLRVRVDGSVDFFIRGAEIRYRVRSGAPPTDEGSEYRQELPLGEVVNLQLDQRDGRNPIRIVEEPSRRNNYTLALSIDDPQGGAGRYHARITWEDSRLASPFEPDRTRPQQPVPDRGSKPSRGACFYAEPNYRGDYFCLETGSREPRLPAGWAGRIRSVSVHGPARVLVHSEESFRGASLGLAAGVGDLRNFFYADRVFREWSGAISSIRVD